MEITQQIREFAAEKGIVAEKAVEVGLAEKAAEYRRDRS
jgi:hypothetical protein